MTKEAVLPVAHGARDPGNEGNRKVEGIDEIGRGCPDGPISMPSRPGSGMLLHENDDFTLERNGRFLRATLKRPHRVLTNCHVNGGLREDLTHICNHQVSEGAGHGSRYVPIPGMGLDGYHYRACEEAGIPGATAALMSTAANMQCAVLAVARQEELVVRVAATAGVLGNATRAGDPAGWHETAQGNRKIETESRIDPGIETPPQNRGKVLGGTVVTMAFINRPCTPACLVRAATMVTEGKSVAILDLRMPSRQSSRLATGTGTDQIAIAAPLAGEDGDWERQWAGSHNSLGELLGRATRDAVRRCLLLQNGVCAELRRSICGALGRHGCDEDALRRCARAELSAEAAELFERNLLALIHDPQSAAAAYCLAESIDLAAAGVLHREVAGEAILNQAALLAATVAVQPDRFAEFRNYLQTQQGRDPSRLAALAAIRGFSVKWS
jgi:adenosylcobinamide amidohydrolase